MNKKITISTLIIILIIVVIFLLNSKKTSNPQVVDTTTRNDTIIQSYSLSDVALHNKATDCWMIIDEKVIDPTAFIAAGLHPNDKIVNGCGKDATTMFTQVDKHDGGKAKAALKQYEIGVLK